MTVTDQMGYQVAIPLLPQRIISLVPSQTELLYDLGLEDRIVGITKFCIHPTQALKTKTVVGGTKNFHHAVIHQLKPDLIIGNKEENYPEGIQALQSQYPVWMSDIANLEEALVMMLQIGKITGTTAEATLLVQEIQQAFQYLKPMQQMRVAYFIWKDPYMAAGQETFIQDLLQKAGLENVFRNLPRYPELTPEAIRQAKPEVVLLSSEPFPFREKHLQEFRDLCPDSLVKLVDGEMFSWYGSRLRQAPTYFRHLYQEIAASPKLFPSSR